MKASKGKRASKALKAKTKGFVLALKPLKASKPFVSKGSKGLRTFQCEGTSKSPSTLIFEAFEGFKGEDEAPFVC